MSTCTVPPGLTLYGGGMAALLFNPNHLMRLGRGVVRPVGLDLGYNSSGQMTGPG